MPLLRFLEEVSSRTAALRRKTVLIDTLTQGIEKISNGALRECVNRDLGSDTILAALDALLDAQVTATSLDPALRAMIDEILDALGLVAMREAFIRGRFMPAWHDNDLAPWQLRIESAASSRRSFCDSFSIGSLARRVEGLHRSLPHSQ